MLLMRDGACAKSSDLIPFDLFFFYSSISILLLITVVSHVFFFLHDDIVPRQIMSN